MDELKGLVVPKGYSTSASDESITILWLGDSLQERGTASADHLDAGVWWVNRVLVQPDTLRGKGIGSELVRRLQEEVSKRGCKRLIVAPGGYDTSRTLQRRFYARCGFVPDADTGMVWYPTQEDT